MLKTVNPFGCLQSMLTFNCHEILGWEQRYRTNFINSLKGASPLFLVGTTNNLHQHNLAPFNSLVHIGANPPFLGLIFRPDSVERHTLTNIREQKHYTLNSVSVHQVEAAHQTAARYKKDESEFELNGFEPCFENNFSAPSVSGAKIRIGLSLAAEIPIPLNGTLLVIGLIEWVHLPSEWIANDGFVQHQSLASAIGLDAYAESNIINRFSYPKPFEKVKSIL